MKKQEEATLESDKIYNKKLTLKLYLPMRNVSNLIDGVFG